MINYCIEDSKKKSNVLDLSKDPTEIVFRSSMLEAFGRHKKVDWLVTLGSSGGVGQHKKSGLESKGDQTW